MPLDLPVFSPSSPGGTLHTYPTKAFQQRTIVVLGAGAFGTAFAVLLGRTGHKVHLLDIVESRIKGINDTRHNPDFLTQYKLPDTVSAFFDPAEAFTADVDYVFHVIPIQFSLNYLKSIKKFILREHIEGFVQKQSLPIVSLAKGIHLEKLQLMHEVFADVFEYDIKDVTKSLEECSLEQVVLDAAPSANNSSIFEAKPADAKPAAATKFPSIVPVFLSGPSFAEEICQNLPTGFTIASPNMAVAKDVAELVNEDKMSVATMSTDYIGVQVVGALKNVYAIFLGMIDGLGYQYNTKSMFMTLANNELRRIAVDYYGGQPRTSSGLAGMGDLVLSCTGPSRNCALGRELATGAKIKDILASSKGVCEGYPTTKAIYTLLNEKGFIKQCPILRCIYNIVYLGQPIDEVFDYLMSLPVQLDAE